MIHRVVAGDLLDQPAEAIVNPWNRNIIPWWPLLPGGVSGVIKRRAGVVPFRGLGRFGPIPLGEAVATSAGRLPFKAIIHVAGIDILWRVSEVSIAGSVRGAVGLAGRLGLRSLAFPVIGAGHGGFDPAAAERVMAGAFASIDSPADATVVRFRKARAVRP